MFEIHVENLRFTYADKYRKSGFELVVDEFFPIGCVAITGENGSGKTTLGKLIAGVLRPSAGCVRYDGVDIAGLKLGEIGRQVGYLFQEPSRQIFTSSPLAEIALPLELRGVPAGEAREQALALLEEFELTQIIDSTTFTLSRGEKQRLAIAAMMVMRPRFFVLDEPTTGLDKARRQILARTLHKLQDDGARILLISHDEEFVDTMGATVRRMKGGRLLEA